MDALLFGLTSECRGRGDGLRLGFWFVQFDEGGI